MREVFEDEELQPFDEQRDTEVTLGPMALAGLICGLLLLCCLCFWFGYSMGSRGKGAVTAGASSAAPVGGAAVGSASKPGATAPGTSSAQSAAAASQYQAPNTNPVANSSSDSSSGQPMSPVMVQIATVSSHEDADVLVSALRNRGYAVSLSQDEGDGKFHVRVGPFASVSEANTMRQKLLNDGYNAVVQP